TMSFPIAPANQQKAGYELVSLPSHGKLTLSDVDMKVGDKYTQEDVSQGRFKYVQNKPLTSKADVTDTFKFKIWEKDKFN
ncbi:cadherin-like domain-containing protein, partial [Escherichia coli]|uniref:cadherin-like domain-containing protein n=1 Tax=Escherichia coli TaxID=562 RepID=UPI001965D267